MKIKNNDLYPPLRAVTSARSPALNELIMECTNYYFIFLFFLPYHLVTPSLR